MGQAWAAVKRWAINLLVAYACFAGFGLLIGGLGGLLWHGHPAWTVGAAYVIAVAFGLVAAAAIRGYLPRVRDRASDLSADLEIWLFDHPVVYVGMYGAIGLIATAALPELQAKLVAVATWGLVGYFSLRGWRKRVAAARASH